MEEKEVVVKVVNLPSRKLGWTLLAIYIGILAMTLAAGMVYSNYRADKAAKQAAQIAFHQSEQELCPLFALYRDAYPDGAPKQATKQAQKFINEALRQYAIRDCVHYVPPTK